MLLYSSSIIAPVCFIVLLLWMLSLEDVYAASLSYKNRVIVIRDLAENRLRPSMEVTHLNPFGVDVTFLY